MNDKKTITAEEIHDKAIEFILEDDFSNAILHCDKVISLLHGEETESSQNLYASALSLKADAFERDNQIEKAIQYYCEVVAKFKQSAIPDIQENCVSSWYNKALLLDDLNQKINCYQSLVDHFIDVNNSDIQETIAQAMFNLGNNYCKNNQHKKGINAYDRLIQHYSESLEEVLQVEVCKAYYNKSKTLYYDLKDLEATISCNNEAIEHFKSTNHSEILALIAILHFDNVGIYYKLEQKDNALSETKVIRSLAEQNDDEYFSEISNLLKNTEAYQKIVIAKKSWSTLSTRKVFLEEAKEDLNTFYRPDAYNLLYNNNTTPILYTFHPSYVARILFNMAYVNWLTENSNLSKNLINEALQILANENDGTSGKDRDIEGHLDEVNYFPIEEDKEYIQLFRKLVAEHELL